MEREDFEPHKYALQKIEALRRQGELLAWLGGEGSRTEAEESIASKFMSDDKDIFASRAIAIYRRGQLNKILSANTPLSDKEIKLTEQLLSPNKELFAKQLISLHRKGLLRGYLEGEDFEFSSFESNQLLQEGSDDLFSNQE